LGFLGFAHVAEGSLAIFGAVIATPARTPLRGDKGELPATGTASAAEKLNVVGIVAVTNRPTPLQLADQG
jgi:hypothetical protein